MSHAKFVASISFKKFVVDHRRTGRGPTQPETRKLHRAAGPERRAIKTTRRAVEGQPTP